MKELGLPLGFMNRSPFDVDDEGKVRIPDSCSATSSVASFNESSNNSVDFNCGIAANRNKKRSNKKHGKKKVIWV